MFAMPKAKAADPPRARRFTVVLSEVELQQLAAAAREQGISRADVLRGALRNYPVSAALPLGLSTNATRRDAT